MSNFLEDNIKYIAKEYNKQLKEIEKAIYKMRSALFDAQSQFRFTTDILEQEYGFKMDTDLIIDNVEAEYKDNILKITIFDVPPIYKVTTTSDILKWKEIMNKAITLLPTKPHFEKAHVAFEFYVPESVALKADTDNRMIKTIIDALVMHGIIPSDTMTHISFSCVGFPIDNMYPKTLIKVTDRHNMLQIISVKPDTTVADKLPVNI
ncbi:hypothetical protein [Anaerocellum danielii]|uniref:Uncharacterized protein n=1 Tax=Anaerocellum danielii TaxID=1387557 RepID=A0ABZ0TYB6_9FIRM|nr:hypothetical protein [Caldicellulosiruptor danielii]WPX08212.1 hypothetical protein SOJ16_002079 [Caldicellulosiruptor danielii]